MLKKKYHIDLIFITIVILLCLMGTMVVLLDGFPKTGFDSQIQAKWYTNFSAELLAGDFYPRWLRGMNAGLGSPVFFSYGPLSYYISVIFEPICDDPYGWCQLGWSSIIALIASGITMYVWLRVITGDCFAALAGSCTYILAPYHLSFLLYTTSSISKLWAFAWLPLILLGVYMIVRGHRFGLWIFLFSETALLLTNLASSLLFAPVPFIYATVIASPGKRINTLSFIFLIFCASTALSAPYILGYLGTKGYISFEAFVSDGFYYKKHFLDYPQKSAFPLAMTVQTAILTGCGAVAALIVNSKYLNLIISWFCIAIISIFLMHSNSDWIWRAVPILQSLQFPWRYLTVLTFSAAVISAYAVQGIRRQPHFLAYTMLFICLAFLCYWSIYTAKKQYWNMINNDNITASVMRQTITTSFDLDHFRPKWVGDSFWPRYSDMNERIAAMESSHIYTNKAILTTRDHPRTLHADVKEHANSWVVLDQFYFPEWKGISDKGHNIEIKPSKPEGLVSVWVPTGTNSVKLKMPYIVHEIIGWILAAIALIFMAALDNKLSRNGFKAISHTDNIP